MLFPDPHNQCMRTKINADGTRVKEAGLVVVGWQQPAFCLCLRLPTGSNDNGKSKLLIIDGIKVPARP